MISTRQRIKAMALVMAVVLSPGCFGEDSSDHQQIRPLSIQLDHRVVVPTSVLRIELGGTHRTVTDAVDIEFDGIVDGRDVETNFEVEARRDGTVGDLYVEMEAGEVLWPSLEPGDAGEFVGDLRVELEDVLGVVAGGTLEDLELRFVRELEPRLTIDVSEPFFPGAAVDVKGDGVVRPDEGQTVAAVQQGGFEADAGHSIDLGGQYLPVEWTGSRKEGRLHLDPAVIGVHPGRLEAEVVFENHFRDGTVVSSPAESQSLQGDMERTFVARVDPEEGSRGQLVDIEGRGFVDSEQTGSYGMVLRFDGTLTPRDPQEPTRDFEGGASLEAVPTNVVDDQTIAQQIWYDVEDGRLEGLGAVPGRFEGRIIPLVYDDYGQVTGIEWEGSLEVLPTRQVVYLKYLPSFSVALDRYGLINVEYEIRERIREVVARDYAGVNVEFVQEEPADFAEYATIELGGPDPSGGDAFGFDNTYHDDAKDTGNLYLDSYLGGINRETGEELNNPYGGIFVESFAVFSATLRPEMAAATPRFDDIFGPFMAELGGDEVRATEWPDGDRSEEIAEAIRVFGNVVGNTVSHELGHSLGMTHFEEDWDSPGHIFHNTDPGGFIMDAGQDRSFEQRAELDGQGPEVFNERNRAYLEEILPLD